MSQRGQYGRAIVGQVPSTVYIERASPSVVPWILGTIAVGSAVLWARHQSRQIDQLQKKAGLPDQSFVSSLRQGAGVSLRGLAERVLPAAKEKLREAEADREQLAASRSARKAKRS